MSKNALFKADEGNGFPRSHRLLKGQDFKRVLGKGCKWVDKAFVLYALPVHGDHKLGMIVSKKVGPAVVRNFVKRHVREVFRHRRWKIRSGDALEWVVIARANARETPSEILQEQLNYAMRRLALKQAKISSSLKKLPSES